MEPASAKLSTFWRGLSLAKKVAIGGLATSLPIVTLFVVIPRFGSGPPSPNVYPQGPQTIYWNGWAAPQGAPFSPTRQFNIESDYQITLDLSGIDYSRSSKSVSSVSSGAEFRRKLENLVRNSLNKVATLKILFLPDPIFFDQPKNGGIAEMNIDLKAVSSALFTQPSSDPLSMMRVQPRPDFLIGRATLTLHTRKHSGTTSVGISIWDGIRPIDGFAIPLCIGSVAQCHEKAANQMSLDGFDALRLAGERSTDRSTYPDGALHFIDLNIGTAIGVFHRKDWPVERFLSWRLRDSPETLKEWLRDKLVPSFNLCRTPEELTERGLDLFDRLFPDNEEGGEARAAFQRFFLDYQFSTHNGSPASLFVRMLPQATDPLPILPIGLMAVPTGEGPGFVGLQFRVESPLENQDYMAGHTCLSDWVMLIPPENSGLDDARARVASNIKHWQNTRVVFDDIKNFRIWARDNSEDSPATILATLSHHDRDRLYFRSSESIMSTGLHRRFASPSIAILDGCGTGNIGAIDIVRALNRNGVTAVIATSTEISPPLAADFLSTLDETLSSRESADMPLTLVMFTTLTRLQTKHRSKTDGPYGPFVLAYSLLGNGNLKLCRLKNKEN